MKQMVSARPDPDSFGARLVAFRKTRGLSLSELAAHAGLSKGHLSEIEHGKHLPSVTTAAWLAVALGCSLDDLSGISSADRNAHSGLCHAVIGLRVLLACGEKFEVG